MEILIILRKYFKYITVISTFTEHIFSEHFQLIFDNSNVKSDKQITQKITNFFFENSSELSNFSSLSFWEKPLWNQKLLLLTAIARRCYYTLVRPFPTLIVFHFFTNFLN